MKKREECIYSVVSPAGHEDVCAARQQVAAGAVDLGDDALPFLGDELLNPTGSSSVLCRPLLSHSHLFPSGSAPKRGALHW